MIPEQGMIGFPDFSASTRALFATTARWTLLTEKAWHGMARCQSTGGQNIAGRHDFLNKVAVGCSCCCCCGIFCPPCEPVEAKTSHATVKWKAYIHGNLYVPYVWKLNRHRTLNSLNHIASSVWYAMHSYKKLGQKQLDTQWMHFHRLSKPGTFVDGLSH